MCLCHDPSLWKCANYIVPDIYLYNNVHKNIYSSLQFTLCKHTSYVTDNTDMLFFFYSLKNFMQFM